MQNDEKTEEIPGLIRGRDQRYSGQKMTSYIYKENPKTRERPTRTKKSPRTSQPVTRKGQTPVTRTWTTGKTRAIVLLKERKKAVEKTSMEEVMRWSRGKEMMQKSALKNLSSAVEKRWSSIEKVWDETAIYMPDKISMRKLEGPLMHTDLK